MTLSRNQLETWLARLEDLASRLRHDARPDDHALAHTDPLVAIANTCEFPLPSPLTIATLRQTVQRKIENAILLSERRHAQQELPVEVCAANDQEDMFVEIGLRPERGGSSQRGQADRIVKVRRPYACSPPPAAASFSPRYKTTSASSAATVEA